MSALVELAERVEAATGPDRELDCDIGLAVGAVVLADEYEPRQVFGRSFSTFTGPRYTSSIDAAMQLVPEGWQLRQMNFSASCADDRKWHLNLYGGREGEDYFVGRGATPALALTAAALRARAQHEGGDNG